MEQAEPLEWFEKDVRGAVLVELVKSIAKVVFISLFAWWMLSSQFNHLLNLSLEGFPGGIIDALDLLLWMLIILCCALIPIVAIDVPFQTWNHNRQLKMTKQEIKDEFKDSEGKPEVKGRIRQLQMQMAMRRMMGMCPRRTSSSPTRPTTRWP